MYAHATGHTRIHTHNKYKYLECIKVDNIAVSHCLILVISLHEFLLAKKQNNILQNSMQGCTFYSLDFPFAITARNFEKHFLEIEIGALYNACTKKTEKLKMPLR